jgi:hypothetical protein
VILGGAEEEGIEKGRKVRVDCRVTESNIHHPTDSSLLLDSVRVLCRLTQRAKEKFGMRMSVHSMGDSPARRPSTGASPPNRTWRASRPWESRTCVRQSRPVLHN